jgi:hypothetical protein
MSAGKSRGTGTDYRHLAPIAGTLQALRKLGLVPLPLVARLGVGLLQIFSRIGLARFSPIALRDEALKSAYSYGCIEIPTATFVFTRGGTYPPAHGSEGIRGPRRKVGFAVPFLRYELNISAGISSHRTGGLTGNPVHPVGFIR